MTVVLLFITFIFVLFLGAFSFSSTQKSQNVSIPNSQLPANETKEPSNSFHEIDTEELVPVPTQKLIQNSYHVVQTFNNCGPAALSMALSYYGINATQAELGNALRPYQIANGDNDDKSTTLEEMAFEAEKRGLTAYHRPNGNTDIIEKFIANDIPVIARTWLKTNEDIGHYRVVKGYDKQNKHLIQDDSLQGANIIYTYDEFNELWDKFGFEYLVLVPKEKNELALQILGEDINEKKVWEKALLARQKKVSGTQNPTANDLLSLSVAYYMVGDYENSIKIYELAAPSLPQRALWYQIEPILAYQKSGEYEEVFLITDRILKNGNRAFSELYIIRGEILLEQGKKEEAIAEFEKAVTYNKNLETAKSALENAKSL